MKNLAIGVVCTVVGFFAGMFTYKVYSDRFVEEELDEREKAIEEARQKILEDQKKRHYETLASTYERESEDPKPTIKIITEAHYAENNGFEKHTWTYYTVDGTVTDDNDEAVTCPEENIGSEFENNFGNMSEDPDTIYIRNEKLGTDYEVIRVEEAYYVTSEEIEELING